MPRISKEAKKKVRADLLQSAARHFALHGVGGANINRISLDAGYAKGTVYNYFSSKEELFAAVLGMGSDETIARYHARTDLTDLRSRLRAIVEEDAALVQQHEDFMKCLARELVAPSPGVRAQVEAAIAPLVMLVAQVLAEGQAAGKVRTDLEAPQLALAFLGSLTMAYVQLWSTEGAWPTWEGLPELVVGMFLDGAGAA